MRVLQQVKAPSRNWTLEGQIRVVPHEWMGPLSHQHQSHLFGSARGPKNSQNQKTQINVQMTKLPQKPFRLKFQGDYLPCV